MRRRWGIGTTVIALALGVIACSGSLPTITLFAQPEGEGSQEGDDTSQAEAPAPPSGDTAFPAAGRLVVIGEDGNLYLMEAGEEPQALTSDALAMEDGLSGRVYSHPTWSPTGWLSYVRAEVLPGKEPTLDVLAVRPGEGEPVSLLSTTEDSYLYGYWSPAACATGAQCGQFAFLMSDDANMALHLAEVNTGGEGLASEKTVGRARPFYYSWAPDGGSMLWFRNGEDLAIYDVNDDEVGESLPDTPGVFQAPAWSPVDERLLFAGSGEDGNQMVIADNDKRTQLGPPIKGLIFFSWSPDGRQVAYASGGYPLSDLTVTGADGGEGHSVVDVDDIVSFFWSPDSTRLAFVSVEDYAQPLPEVRRIGVLAHPAAQVDEPTFVLVWHVLDVETGQTTRLAEFLPTPAQFYILQYFDQYAQSHRVWSPDGRYLVYAHQPPDQGKAEIRLIDTLQPGEPPITLVEGRQAIFSFGE
jgi:TolB protein